MSFGDPAGESHQDERTAAAITLTRKFIKDHGSIADDDFSNIRQVFTEKEISALCTYIAFMAGAVKFGALVGLNSNDADSFVLSHK